MTASLGIWAPRIAEQFYGGDWKWCGLEVKGDDIEVKLRESTDRKKWGKITRKIIVSQQQCDEAALAYEQETGACSRCIGHPGQEIAGWSKDAGTKYRECPRCKSTGKANHYWRAA